MHERAGQCVSRGAGPDGRDRGPDGHANFVGPKSTILYVNLITASGREAEVGLGVSSQILSDVVLNPGSIDFGTVVRGQSPTQVLTIDRINAEGWRFMRMVSGSPSSMPSSSRRAGMGVP